MSTDDGFVLLERSTLGEIARLALPVGHGLRAHALLASQQAMVMIDQMRPRQLGVARW